MMGPTSQGTELGVRIKWPNDIYCGNLKLGGILCQTAYRDQKFHLVSGVGLNLDNPEPTTCINALFEARQRAAGLSPPFTRVCKEVGTFIPAAYGGASRCGGYLRSVREVFQRRSIRLPTSRDVMFLLF
jgi:Biotin/lipoate A/B protein ligase family